MTKQEIHDLFCQFWPGPVTRLEARADSAGNRWYAQLGLYVEALGGFDARHVRDACRRLWLEQGPERLPAAGDVIRLARDIRDDEQRRREAAAPAGEPERVSTPDWVRRANQARGKDPEAWIEAMMERFAAASDEVKRIRREQFRAAAACWDVEVTA